MNPDIAAAFPHVPGYLDTACYGLPARATTRALHGAADDWAVAATDPSALDPCVERMRAAFATLVGASAADIALAGSVSQVVGMVAASLPDGARVLAAEHDFGSVIFPFLADPRLDVTLVPIEALPDAVVPGVDLVAVSAVQSSDGRVTDLAALATAARAAGARTVVDMSHGAGWLPIDARDFDVVAAAGYKWLTSPRGLAFAAIRHEAYNGPGGWLRPVNASWYGADRPWESLYGPRWNASRTARRFDTSPPWLLVEAGAVALELLAAQPVREVNDYAIGLANQFREGIGLAPSNSAILSVTGVRAEELARAGVRASSRDGRTRFSFYLYNDERDVRAGIAAVRASSLAAVAS